jgi:adenine-specific DNA-methyltransferase
MDIESFKIQSLDTSDDLSLEANIVLFKGRAGDLATRIPDGSISLIVASPPYNIGKEYEEKSDIDSYLRSFRPLLEQLCGLLTDDGSLCWQVGNYINEGEVFPLDMFYYAIFKEFGLQLRNRIVWRFGHGLHAQKRFSGRYETLLWFSKSKNYKFNLDPVRVPAKYPNKRHSKGKNKGELSGNPKGKNPSDVWEILLSDWDNGVWDIPNVKANHCEASIHPCQFPVELVERCVLALTHEGDTVFDPFMGVGSSVIAAIKNGRKAIGSDKEQRYVDVAEERVRKYINGELRLRQLGTPLFPPSEAGRVATIPKEWILQSDSIYSSTKIEKISGSSQPKI